MELSTGLVLKVLGGLGVATVGSVGIYYTNDYFQSALTRFDRGLIEYLDGENNDIVFTVKHGSNTDLTTFLTNFTENDLNITVEVSASNSGDANLKGTNNDAAKKKLQKLNAAANGNEGTAWTWVCEMKFERHTDSSSVSAINDDEKDRIYKSTDRGLFGKLKKDVSSSSSEAAEKKKIKDIKRDFIKKCALARTRSENKKIDNEKSLSTENAKVITPAKEITFELKKGTSDATKLFFVDKDKFNYWFLEEPKTT